MDLCENGCGRPASPGWKICDECRDAEEREAETAVATLEGVDVEALAVEELEKLTEAAGRPRLGRVGNAGEKEDVIMSDGQCAVEGCGGKARMRGVCWSCYGKRKAETPEGEKIRAVIAPPRAGNFGGKGNIKKLRRVADETRARFEKRRAGSVGAGEEGAGTPRMLATAAVQVVLGALGVPSLTTECPNHDSLLLVPREDKVVVFTIGADGHVRPGRIVPVEG